MRYDQQKNGKPFATQEDDTGVPKQIENEQEKIHSKNQSIPVTNEKLSEEEAKTNQKDIKDIYMMVKQLWKKIDESLGNKEEVMNEINSLIINSNNASYVNKLQNEFIGNENDLKNPTNGEQNGSNSEQNCTNGEKNDPNRCFENANKQQYAANFINESNNLQNSNIQNETAKQQSNIDENSLHKETEIAHKTTAPNTNPIDENTCHELIRCGLIDIVVHSDGRVITYERNKAAPVQKPDVLNEGVEEVVEGVQQLDLDGKTSKEPVSSVDSVVESKSSEKPQKIDAEKIADEKSKQETTLEEVENKDMDSSLVDYSDFTVLSKLGRGGELSNSSLLFPNVDHFNFQLV